MYIVITFQVQGVAKYYIMKQITTVMNLFNVVNYKNFLLCTL